MALRGQLWVNVFVFSRAKDSEFYWSLAVKTELEQLGRSHGKKNWTKKFKPEKTRNSFFAFILQSAFLILVKAFRLFLLSLFGRNYFLSLLLHAFNICEIIYTMKVVKGGTPLVSLRLRSGITNMTVFYGHTWIQDEN